MAEAAVQARNLKRSFGAVKAVDGVDFDVGAGEIFGIIGPDGAGKTTTLRLLAGVLRCHSGSVQIAGIDAIKDIEKARLNLGYMPQRFSVYGDLTIDENMKFFDDLYGIRGKAFSDRREELLEFSRLGPHRKKVGQALSGGMQKKLALSCVLFHRPKVLLLDEPTNGVDPVSRRELWGLLYELIGGGTTIVVSTAYMDEAERCSRVALLYQGRVLTCAEPSQLLRSAGREERGGHDLEEVFVRLIEERGRQR
jgi:ABC-2 type transport system ATP-binding protein